MDADERGVLLADDVVLDVADFSNSDLVEAQLVVVEHLAGMCCLGHGKFLSLRE